MGEKLEELLEKLATLFGEYQATFDLAEAAQARALAAIQPHLYASLIGAFRNVPFNDGQQQGSVDSSGFTSTVFDWIGGAVRDEQPSVVQIGHRVAVTAKLPLLSDPEVQAIVTFVKSVNQASRTSDVARQFCSGLAAALLVEARGIKSRPTNTSDGLGSSDIFWVYCRVAEYSAIKAGRRGQEATTVSFQSEIAATKGAIENYRVEFETQRSRQREELDQLSGATVDLEATLKAYEKELVDSKARLENFETAIREEVRLDRSRLSWEERYKEARIGFWIACGLLVVFLTATIGTAVMFGPEFILKLAKIEKDTTNGDPSIAIALTHQFGRLIVFSVPVIVYLWMLRAVMRFFMRSMLLMDDARQRQTMLDTYFLLSEKGRADERDRPLILWALFRQTPGHGPDGVEPPDFTEVINAGLKRGAAGE